MQTESPTSTVLAPYKFRIVIKIVSSDRFFMYHSVVCSGSNGSIWNIFNKSHDETDSSTTAVMINFFIKKEFIRKVNKHRGPHTKGEMVYPKNF